MGLAGTGGTGRGQPGNQATDGDPGALVRSDHDKAHPRPLAVCGGCPQFGPAQYLTQDDPHLHAGEGGTEAEPVTAAERQPEGRVGWLGGEAMTQAEHSQELRAQLSLGYERLRNTIAETVIAMAPELPQDQARDVASFLIAVNDGLMVQWLLDPERSLDGERAFDAAKMIFGA